MNEYNILIIIINKMYEKFEGNIINSFLIVDTLNVHVIYIN